MNDDIYKTVFRLDALIDSMMAEQQTDLLLGGTDAEFDREVEKMIRDFSDKMESEEK